MEARTLLTPLVIVASLFGASAGKFENIESDKPVNIPLPFKPWLNIGSRSLASPHIVGGNQAIPHSHPHQVVLFIEATTEKGAKKQGLCGGSLLSDSWVVTAAHCVDKSIIIGTKEANSDKAKLVITVGIGAHDISKLKFDKNVQLINASQIISHSEWRLKEIVTDIALLKLEKNVRLGKYCTHKEFGKYVKNQKDSFTCNFADGKYAKSIRLPKLSQKSESFENSTVTMTGWGKTESQSNVRADKLHTVDSRIISNVVCNQKYTFYLKLKITETHICSSGEEEKGTCNGDSGGPMTIKEADGEPTLLGITSYSFGCQFGFPNVFTRVTSYLDWIYNNTNIEPRN